MSSDAKIFIMAGRLEDLHTGRLALREEVKTLLLRANSHKQVGAWEEGTQRKDDLRQ